MHCKTTCLICEGTEEFFNNLSSDETSFLNILNFVIFNLGRETLRFLYEHTLRFCLCSIRRVRAENLEWCELVTSCKCFVRVHGPMNSLEVPTSSDVLIAAHLLQSFEECPVIDFTPSMDKYFTKLGHIVKLVEVVVPRVLEEADKVIDVEDTRVILRTLVKLFLYENFVSIECL